MLFWVLVAIVTLIAALAVMFPFLRRGKRVLDTGHDLEVYKDQLKELERDVKRGLISQADAVEARAEIGRHILRLKDDEDAGGTAKGSAGWARAVATVAVLAVPIASWSLYSMIGAAGMPDLPLSMRGQATTDQTSVQELIERAEKHLADNPDDVRGWEVLAPVYMRLGRYPDAAHAFRRLNTLSGADPERLALLGEALVGISGGVVTAEAENVFQGALSLDPANGRARFFVAMAKAQEGKSDEANAIWRDMLETLPADSSWRGVVEQALNPDSILDAQGESEAPAESVEDGQNPAIDPAMIESMVEGLAQRLAAEPNNPEGWRMLVQSYVVLNREDDALDALERGYAALGSDTEAATSLDSFAKTLGLTRRGTDK